MNLFRKISSQRGGSRVLINTVIIYGQRFSAAVLSLVTTPVVLNALGVEDYGLYALTVGLVGMLAFINWSLSSATQRYIAFSIGAGDLARLKKIFTSSLFIHVVYGLLLLLIIWIFGGLIIEKVLTIPESRIDTAKLIIKFVACISFINIITVPFTGLFRAHENFLYLAIIDITESVFKLGIAISLIFITSDRLVAYSVLLIIVSVIIFILNVLFSNKFYPEVRLNVHNLSRELIIDMVSFMGWSLIGAGAIMSRNQGVSVLLNMFFGVIVNAAYGIAMQVNSAITILSQGIVGSISPQLVKSAGAGDIGKTVYLMRTMSKFAVISVSIVAIPFLIEAPLILKLWLKNVPEGAIIFSRLIIVFGLITGLSAGINNVFQAIGKVKLYNIYVSLILILNLPLAFVLFKVGFKSHTIILTGIFLEIVSLFVRLRLLRNYLDFSLTKFFYDVILRIIIPIILSIGIVLLVKQIHLREYIQLIITMALLFSVYPFIIYYIALDRRQKSFVVEYISKSANHLKIFRNR